MKCVERKNKGVDVNLWFVRRREKREAFHLDGWVKKNDTRYIHLGNGKLNGSRTCVRHGD